MNKLVGFAPNQQPKYPVGVWWSDLAERYFAQCHDCDDWESAMTCDRWQARRWALAHKCKEKR